MIFVATTRAAGIGDEASPLLERAALVWGRYAVIEAYTGRSSVAAGLAI